ncbi:MAG: sulfate reduction electron transfer complex DsrMKJOP subunit DsrJ [Deltaproteobacteria bacterium]|nr:sulfate reduction electron transfer complex DsrMKJOP subunit DsrJ [Deltaproteobacteria bacterium]
MYDGGKIITGLVIGLALLLFPFFYTAGKAARAPERELTAKAKEAEKCIEATAFMKTGHMKLLDEWRDEVVRDADRYYTSNLTGEVHYKSIQVTCMECHSNKTKFCDRCHTYAGVDPFCWDCHIAPKESE